jgi:Leucine-rich repeat (LRR) protein
LRILVLSRNRLTSLHAVAALPSLLALDVDHNALVDIQTEELPPNLLYLNCEGNPFHDSVATYMRLFADAELRTIDGLDEDAWLEQVNSCCSAKLNRLELNFRCENFKQPNAKLPAGGEGTG